MKKQIAILSLLALGAGALCIGQVVIANQTEVPQKAETQSPQKTEGVPAVLNFKMKSLSGEDVELSKYSGDVVLMVNTASKCGFTKQYKGLQELHKKYAEQGLKILGFPSADFGNQEFGADDEISSFCQKNYGVEFDMFSRVKVKGEGKTPLYEYLTSDQTNPKYPGEVSWNFEKFLIGRNGEIIGRYKSAVTPDSPELVTAIEAALAQK